VKNLLKYIADYSNQDNYLFSNSVEDRNRNCMRELQQRRFLLGSGGERWQQYKYQSTATDCSEELV